MKPGVSNHETLRNISPNEQVDMAGRLQLAGGFISSDFFAWVRQKEYHRTPACDYATLNSRVAEDISLGFDL